MKDFIKFRDKILKICQKNQHNFTKTLFLVLDSDDTIFDTKFFEKTNSVEFFKNKYNMEMVNPNGYNIKEMYNCTDEQQKSFWVANYPKYALTFPPKDGTSATINALKEEENISVVVVMPTAKWKADHKFYGPIVRILNELGLYINGVKIDHIEYVSTDNSHIEKAEVVEILKELGYVIVVDDKKEVVQELENRFSNNPDVKTLCMNTVTNESEKLTSAIRIYNNDDLYVEAKKFIDRITGEESFFSTFEKITREQREKLSPAELKVYYQNLREFYFRLPFDVKKMIKGEKNFKIFASIVSYLYNKKYEINVIGKELIPKDENFIIVSNHLCSKDMLLIATALEGVVWHPLIKKEIFNEPSGFIFKLIDCITVDRNSKQSGGEAINGVVKRLLHGANVLVFPESTYKYKLVSPDENIAPFKKGAVIASQISGRRILPISITDNYDSGRLFVKINNPMSVEIHDDIEKVNQELQNTVDESYEFIKKL